jgi:regulator of nucleoside diphosphate kinase
VSVFSPVGTAILGFREGDRIHWPGTDGHISIEIEKVLYQPEAAGDFHL